MKAMMAVTALAGQARLLLFCWLVLWSLFGAHGINYHA